jgi:hypothetical protein
LTSPHPRQHTIRETSQDCDGHFTGALGPDCTYTDLFLSNCRSCILAVYTELSDQSDAQDITHNRLQPCPQSCELRTPTVLITRHFCPMRSDQTYLLGRPKKNCNKAAGCTRSAHDTASSYTTVKLDHVIFTTASLELSLQCLSTHSLSLRKCCQRKWKCENGCRENETCSGVSLQLVIPMHHHRTHPG